MSREAKRAFPCFGGTVTVHVGGRSAKRSAEEAADRAEALLLEAHRRLSRFLPDSELCRLNADPRTTVSVSPLMLEVAAAVRRAGLLSGGLVDGTLLGQIEAAGYRTSLAGGAALPSPGRWPAVARSPARASPDPGWRQIAVDRPARTVTRPPGVRIDSGGIAKGLLADLVGATLAGHACFAVDCCGDVRIGGRSGQVRSAIVEGPLGGGPLHELGIVRGAVATSGIGRRAWAGESGEAAHHLLDPATGTPAFTGVIQATAQAPTAFLAEVHAKRALLSGPERAAELLPYGGVIVLEDGSPRLVAAERKLQVAAA